MITVDMFCGDFFSRVVFESDIYDFEDMNGNLIYSSKLGCYGGTAFNKFLTENKNRRIRWVRKHRDEYKELLIILA